MIESKGRIPACTDETTRFFNIYNSLQFINMVSSWSSSNRLLEVEKEILEGEWEK